MVLKFCDNRLRIDWLDTENLTFILEIRAALQIM